MPKFKGIAQEIWGENHLPSQVDCRRGFFTTNTRTAENLLNKSYMEFHENPTNVFVAGNGIKTDGRTDGRTDGLTLSPHTTLFLT
jgi:hypothetical protein